VGMLKENLRIYKCPQQFIQFKLGLRKASSLKQSIIFSLNNNEDINDIERFLKKNSYRYNLNKQHGLLLVEPLHV
jgi:hypothetical protein